MENTKNIRTVYFEFLPQLVISVLFWPQVCLPAVFLWLSWIAISLGLALSQHGVLAVIPTSSQYSHSLPLHHRSGPLSKARNTSDMPVIH